LSGRTNALHTFRSTFNFLTTVFTKHLFMHTKLNQSHPHCICIRSSQSCMIPRAYIFSPAHIKQVPHYKRKEYYWSFTLSATPYLAFTSLFLISNICVSGKAALPSRRKTVVEKYPAVLDCLIDSNLPSENVIYSWTKNGADATSDARATIIASGALFIKSTRRTDSGVYMCTAKTFDSNGLVNYPGTDIMLDVQCKLMAIETCWGAGMAQWWERSPPTNEVRFRFRPGAICGLSLLLFLAMLRGFFFRVLRFSSLHKNQHLQIPIRSG